MHWRLTKTRDSCTSANDSLWSFSNTTNVSSRALMNCEQRFFAPPTEQQQILVLAVQRNKTVSMRCFWRASRAAASVVLCWCLSLTQLPSIIYLQIAKVFVVAFVSAQNDYETFRWVVCATLSVEVGCVYHQRWLKFIGFRSSCLHCCQAISRRVWLIYHKLTGTFYRIWHNFYEQFCMEQHASCKLGSDCTERAGGVIFTRLINFRISPHQIVPCRHRA